jgi:uncharacterized peroxidase-related enzyme
MATSIKGVEPAQSAALSEIEKKTGPSNFLRVMAHRPVAMQDFVRLYEDLMGPKAILDRRIREMVYLAVSCVNECAYCTAHHTKTAAAAGLSSTEVREIEVENNSHFPPKEVAALHYARELTRTALVREDLRYRVEELFTHEEFVELTMIIGIANFTNRFNNGLAVSLEG